MATGHSPFRAPTTMAVLRRVCDESPRPLRDSNPEIPSWLAAIVDRMLAKDPAQRYDSANEVAAVLSGRLARLQQAASTLETGEVAKHATKPRRRPIAVAIVVLFGLLAGTEALGVSGVTKFIATVLRIRTPDGTLVLNVEDPSISVLLDDRTSSSPRAARNPPQAGLQAPRDQGREPD